MLPDVTIEMVGEDESLTPADVEAGPDIIPDVEIDTGTSTEPETEKEGERKQN